jgi:hypothetical protein
MCLIRKDLSTVWCEVTSSIRTRTSDEEEGEETTPSLQPSGSNFDGNGTKQGQLELLLCLRPIREGDKKVDESLRFVPLPTANSSLLRKAFGEAFVSTSSGDYNHDENGDSDRTSIEILPNNQAAAAACGPENAKRPPKKRALAVDMEAMSTDHDPTPRKRAKPDDSGQGDRASDDTEKSVVESLMLMNKSSQ